MNSVALISNFNNPFELKEIEDKTIKLGLEIKARIKLDDFSIEDLSYLELHEALIVINAGDQKIKALEICKNLKCLTQRLKILILLQEISIEESNIFGFFQAYICTKNNFEITIPKIIIPKKFEKSNKIILFASITESEQDSFETVLCFAKYLSIQNKKILIIEISQSQLINNSLNNNSDLSLYKKQEKSLEAIPLEKIPNCDYITNIVQTKDKLEFINDINFEIEKLNNSYRDNENSFEVKVKYLNELENILSKLKAETSEIGKYILQRYKSSYDFILIELGSDFISQNNRYFFNFAEEIFININSIKSKPQNFFELKNYLYENYKLKSSPLCKERYMANDRSINFNSDLHKFLKQKQIDEYEKNKAQILAEKIYKHLEINSKSSGELCL